MAGPGGDRKTCFVAMPVTTLAPYADDLRDPDHFDHVLTHLFTPALERAGYAVIPPRALGAALIHAEIIRHLEQADLVLADLSTLNPNVFFELGIRTSLDRPVVLVKDGRTATIPFDLGTINVLTYDESLATWTLDEEVRRLAEHVSSVPADGASGNAMWKYFGLTKRAGPAEAGGVEAKVDLLLAEITKLRLVPQLTPGTAAAADSFQRRYSRFSLAARRYAAQAGAVELPVITHNGADEVSVHVSGPRPENAEGLGRLIQGAATAEGFAATIVIEPL